LKTYILKGSHLNPAISFANLLLGKMSAMRFALYCAAQFLGAFMAACLVYLIYFDAFRKHQHYDMYSLDVASVFATYPNSYLSIVGGFFDQTIGTFLLVIVYLSVIDERNADIHWSIGAIIMGLCLTIIGTSLGYNAAYALNPARDFSPRLFSLLAGWGTKTFKAYNYFFWIVSSFKIECSIDNVFVRLLIVDIIFICIFLAHCSSHGWLRYCHDHLHNLHCQFLDDDEDGRCYTPLFILN
jgi:aquaporin-9